MPLNSGIVECGRCTVTQTSLSKILILPTLAAQHFMKLINAREAGRSDAGGKCRITVSLEPQRGKFSVDTSTVLYIVSCSVPRMKFHSAERDRDLKSRGVEYFC